MELYMKRYTFAKGHTQQTENSIPLRNINSVKASLSELWANLVNWRAGEKSGWDHGEDEKKAGKLENENLSWYVYNKTPSLYSVYCVSRFDNSDEKLYFSRDKII